MENSLPAGYAFKSSLNNNPLPAGYAFKSSLPQQEQEVMPQQEQQQPEQPGFGKALLSTALTAPFKMAENAVPKSLDVSGLLPEETRNRIEGVKGFFPEERPKISESIEKSLGTEGYKPSNIFEQALHDTAGNWPLLALTGGLSASAKGAARVGADVAGSLGMRSAEDFGPVAQIGAGVLASKGFNKLAGSLHKSFKNPSKLQKHVSGLYDEEKKLGSSIKVEREPIQKSLMDLEAKVQKKFVNPALFSDAAKNRSLENIRTAGDLINKPNLKASEVFEVKKLLNEVWANNKTTEGKIYQELRGIFKNKLDHVAELPGNSKWGNAWKSADEIYSISKWQSGLGKWMEEISQKGKFGSLVSNPLTQGALSALIGGAVKGPGGLALGAAPGIARVGIKGGESAVRSVKFLNNLSKTNDGRKLLWEIAADSAKNNTNAIASSVNKLNNYAKKWEEENPKD